MNDTHSVMSSKFMTQPVKQDDLLVINLIYSFKVPTCYINQHGEVVLINEAWLTYAGISTEALDHLQWIELIHAAHRYEALAALHNIYAQVGQGSLTCRLVDHNNSNGRWFIVNFHPMGEGWLCTCTDVHDLKVKESEMVSQAQVQTNMLNASIDCIKLISPNGNLLHMNRSGCLALGVSEDSGFGMPWLPLLPEDVWELGNAAIESAKNGVFSRFFGRSVIPGHSPQYWDNMLTPILDAHGRTTAILCVSREVTREHEMLNLLQRSEERLTIAARLGGLGVWDYDIALNVLHCDENCYQVFGCDPTCTIHSMEQICYMIHPDDKMKFMEFDRTVRELASSKRDYEIEYRIVRTDGEVRWIRSVAYLQHHNEVAKRVVGFVLDITDSKHKELRLRSKNRLLESEKASFQRQSLEDGLTGIPNRRHLNDELERICYAHQNNPMQMCFVLIDIDYFKLYNDMYGHLEGDRVLQLVASTLQRFGRRSELDFVARYGGEEFVIIWRHVANPVQMLEDLIQSINQLNIPHASSPEGRVTISCGCTIVDIDSECLSSLRLIKQSDSALYEAKAQGRNRYVIRNVVEH